MDAHLLAFTGSKRIHPAFCLSASTAVVGACFHIFFFLGCRTFLIVLLFLHSANLYIHQGMTVLASKRSMSNAFCSALHILRWQLEFHGLHVHLAEAQTTVSDFSSTHACRLGTGFQTWRVWYHKLWYYGFIVCVCVPKNARFLRPMAESAGLS